MHKKERIILLMHSTEARPKAQTEYMKENMHSQLEHMFTNMPFSLRKIGHISVERLISVLLTHYQAHPHYILMRRPQRDVAHL